MMPELYVRQGEAESGPFNAKQLQDLARSGMLHPESLIRKGTTGRWVPATSVKGLEFPPASSTPALPPAESSTSPHVETALPPEAVGASPAAPPLEPASGEANTQAAIPPPTKPLTRNPLFWLVGGGVAVLALAIVGLTIVVGLLGASYLRRADDETAMKVEQEMKQAAAEAEAEATAKQAAEERAAWLSANFDSELAKQIRANAPDRNSPLFRKLTEFELNNVPANWANEASLIRAGGFATRYGYGSPLLIDPNTLALFVTDGGFHYDLWHLDLNTGNFRKAAAFNQGRKDGHYTSVTYHRQGKSTLAQFEYLDVNPRRDLKPIFQGRSAYGWLDLHTGKMRTDGVEFKTNQSRDFLMEKLTAPKLSGRSTLSMTGGSAAVTTANRKLAESGQYFDDSKGVIELQPDLRRSWRDSFAVVRLEESNATSALRRLQSEVATAPNCPLTASLRPTLQFAHAAAAEDPGGLRAYLDANPNHYLQFHGAMELLHLLAKESDDPEEYLKFQEQDPGTPARDLAILRIHELAFTRACEVASIEVFDDYQSAFPGAQQAQTAAEFAYDLELERARFEIEHAPDPEEKLEQVANGFYVTWRDNLRRGQMPTAERMWKILTEEPDFNRTEAATKAQNQKDTDIYREKMLAIQRERNAILTRIEGIQREQLEVSRQQLQAQYESNDIARSNGAKLDRIGDEFEAFNNKFD